MKILFVRPNFCDKRSSDAMEPLAFAILAALTPPKHELSLADERLAPIPFDVDADLVAITVETYNARRPTRSRRSFASAACAWSWAATTSRFCLMKRCNFAMPLSSATPNSCGLST
jgi:hypothetical protein